MELIKFVSSVELMGIWVLVIISNRLDVLSSVISVLGRIHLDFLLLSNTCWLLGCCGCLL